MGNLLKGRFNVYIVACSKRPELLFGETNLWLEPNLMYGVYQINDNDVFICTEKVARNMSFQGYSQVPQQVTLLYECLGEEIIGFPVRSTCSFYPFVYILPLDYHKTVRATNIVCIDIIPGYWCVCKCSKYRTI